MCVICPQIDSMGRSNNKNNRWWWKKKKTVFFSFYLKLRVRPTVVTTASQMSNFTALNPMRDVNLELCRLWTINEKIYWKGMDTYFLLNMKLNGLMLKARHISVLWKPFTVLNTNHDIARSVTVKFNDPFTNYSWLQITIIWGLSASLSCDLRVCVGL